MKICDFSNISKRYICYYLLIITTMKLRWLASYSIVIMMPLISEKLFIQEPFYAFDASIVVL